MDDQNKKNPYDEFFSPNDRSDQEDRKSSDSRPSYYYSYGPFKSNAGNGEQTNGTQSSGNSNSSYEYSTERPTPPPASDVQITAPQQTRSFAPTAPAANARSGWQVKEKPRTSFKAMFASFLVGVLVIGSLMGVADYQNWFTSGGLLATSGTPESSVPADNNTGSGNSDDGNAGGNISPVSSLLDTARPNNIAQIFEQASPAVVKIETYTQARSGSGSGLDPFFRQFFGDSFTVPESEGDDGGLVQTGIGSGFFFEDTGYILTNQHVVGDSAKIEVTVQGFAKTFEAELLGSSYDLDLAVIKIAGDEPFPTLPLGDSNAISIGDWVVAIGNPHGFDHTVTVGVLSSKERPISIPDSQGTRNYEHLLQTDASINPGNSGGPLINTRGEVIGINTAVSSQAQGIGFAIPTSTIKEVLESLKSNTKIPIPFIGAGLIDVTDEFAQQLGMEETEGSLVREVYYNSPAYRGDLRQFDVILGIDGEEYATTQDLIQAIQEKNVGDTVTLNVFRNGGTLDLTVEIGDRNEFAAIQ